MMKNIQLQNHFCICIYDYAQFYNNVVICKYLLYLSLVLLHGIEANGIDNGETYM